ncbi:hypothetical protein [Paenibacillus glycinis]|uniref:WD40 repeat domain-containing protein n=1 Tax=Paenibacillus glycinis TaxID=2697035 RepID=A0ABW9XNV5_9BACL|nr:hypothetical protein [Paenibacillus glycinis]NBD24305.1 hypothetical protein [Paenibacillus glycinis]
MRSLGENKTIVLDPSLFPAAPDTGFRIDGVLKRALSDGATSVLPLGNDRLLAVTEDLRKDDVLTSSLAVFDVTAGRSETILTDTSLRSYALSPDKSTLVYHTGFEADNKTVWYDLKNMREKDSRLNYDESWEAWRYMVDDDRALEVDGQKVVLRDLRGGQPDRVVVTMSDLDLYLNGGKKNAGYLSGKPLALVPSSDFKRVYMQYFRPDLKQSVFLSVDATSGDIAWAGAGEIQAFAPLRNGGLLLAGSIDGVEGLYGADGSRKPVLLAEGTYTKLAVNPARDVIAYVKTDSDGHQNVMVGRLSGNELTDEFNVYYVPNFVRSLDWSPEGEMLFGVTEGVGGSEVYRFELH